MVIVGDDSKTINEMAIVDIFTGLIFDADSKLNDSQQLVIDALIHVDEGLQNASRRDISEFLRSMGVDEMITVVARIKRIIQRQQSLLASTAHGRAKLIHRNP